jgi:hypothetical protein
LGKKIIKIRFVSKNQNISLIGKNNLIYEDLIPANVFAKSFNETFTLDTSKFQHLNAAKELKLTSVSYEKVALIVLIYKNLKAT